ncbi:MAG: hypothetical protein JWO52_4084 [Gammaproteobacteria bacterium]|nr:hypothetical protein [Gammaproteobacteria bacterium]
MRRLIYVQTRQQAEQVARWACCFAPVGPGAWMCFESATDFASYRRGT